MREIERKEMEQRGLVDAQDTKKSLEDAIIFRGSCKDMCPTYERIQRSLENNVKALEKDPISGRASRTMAVKAFSRPAAGQPPPLPSDVRPPNILIKSLDHLIKTTISKLPESHSFLWDRTRSIRQDFTYQNYLGFESILIHERICRIHIISLHEMTKYSKFEYSKQQELEQFNKCLQSLSETYDYMKLQNIPIQNEGEFRSYQLLSHLRDSDYDRQIQKLSKKLFKNKNIQLSLKLRSILQQCNINQYGYKNSQITYQLFITFFEIIKNSKIPFLISCLLEIHFNEIRLYGLKSISRSYHSKAKPLYASRLTSMFGFDSIDETINFIKYYGLSNKIDDDGLITIDIVTFDNKIAFNKPPLKQGFSKMIEEKRNGRSLENFVYNGLDDSNNSSVNTNVTFENSFIPKKSEITQNQNQNQNSPFGSSPFSTSTLQPNLNINNNLNFNNNNKNNAFSFPTTNNTSNISSSFSFLKKQTSSSSSLVPPVTNTQPFNSNNMFKIPPSEIQISNTIQKEPPQLSVQPKTNVGPSLNLNQPITSSNLQSSTKPETKIKTIVEVKPKPEISEQDIRNELDQLLKSIVSKEVKSIVKTTTTTIINARNQREELLNQLSNELYNSFISESIYIITLELKADLFRNLKLQKSIILKISKIAKESKKKLLIKKKKLEEFNIVSKSLGSPSYLIELERRRSYRRSSQTSFDSDSSIDNNHKNNFKNNKMITNKSSKKRLKMISDENENVKQLWKKISLNEIFLLKINDFLKIKNIWELIFKVLVIVDNFESPSSKWIFKKLGMKLNNNNDDNRYENIIRNDRLISTFTTIPSTFSNQEEFYKDVNFIIFEFGLSSNITTEINLTNELKKLGNILNYILKYSFYKINILVLYDNDILLKNNFGLKLDLFFKSFKEIINGIIPFDLSTESIENYSKHLKLNENKNKNPLDLLFNEKLLNLSNLFKNELSNLGEENQTEIQYLKNLKDDIEYENLQEDLKITDNEKHNEVSLQIELEKEEERKKRFGHLLKHVNDSPRTSELIDGNDDISSQSRFNSRSNSVLYNDTIMLSPSILNVSPYSTPNHYQSNNILSPYKRKQPSNSPSSQPAIPELTTMSQNTSFSYSQTPSIHHIDDEKYQSLSSSKKETTIPNSILELRKLTQSVIKRRKNN